MTILEFFVAVNGMAHLIASDGQFLGVLSINQHDPNSISNPHGNYGSYHGSYSIRNPHGNYGSTNGIYSPYSTYCLHPPIVFYQKQRVLMVTRNVHVQNNGLPVVDPELLGVYAQLGDSISAPKPLDSFADQIVRMFQV